MMVFILDSYGKPVFNIKIPTTSPQHPLDTSKYFYLQYILIGLTMNANHRAAAAAAGSRHHLGSQSQTGYVVKALKEVKIHGKRFSAYPDTGTEAPESEKYHHFSSNNRALE